MKILIIDGQGGKIGKLLTEQIKKGCPDSDITAIGTNSIATSAMLRAGADQGATGENPVLVGSQRADVIVGPIGIVLADALLGEITPAMAQAVNDSPAYKVLIPVNRCNHHIVGTQNASLSDYIRMAAEEINSYSSR